MTLSELIGAIALGFGILLVLSGTGILKIESYINVNRGWGPAIVGVIFALLGGWLLYPSLFPPKIPDPMPIIVAEVTQVPTPEPVVINTVKPEPTSTIEEGPTATPKANPSSTPLVDPTAMATSAPEVEPVVEAVAKLQTTTTNVGIYSGPSDANPRLGLLNFNSELEVLGKVRGGIWYQVIADTGVTGWVDASEVEFINGTDEDVSITWPLSSVSGNDQTGTVNTIACMSTAVERDVYRNVFIKWSNLPDGTRWLYLTIRGELDGEMTDLIQPNNRIDVVNDSDTAEDGFKLGSYLFDPGDPSSKGFPTGTIFSYTLQARDASSEALCAVSDSFQ